MEIQYCGTVVEKAIRRERLWVQILEKRQLLLLTKSNLDKTLAPLANTRRRKSK